MPSGGARRGAGRPKGVPNKVTSRAREAFLLTFRKLEGDLETWIRRTAEGQDTQALNKQGDVVTLKTSPDPGKAADLLIRMAEYHFPKLGRLEHTGEDGAPLVIEVRKYWEGE